MTELRPTAARDRFLQLLLPVLFFCASAPTLPWMEFSSGSENLNVATALEIRRTGNWLMPTLQGQPRVAKPPLTAWITAAFIDRSTFERLSTTDARIRDEAYRNLAWRVRLSALLASCLALALTYELGRMLGGTRLAVIATLMLATSYAMMRFGRAATTDVQLALWVLAGNVALARMTFDDRPGGRWISAVAAGIALALAFLSKGPVALVQSVLPVGCFLAWRISTERKVLGERSSFAYHPRALLRPALAGAAVFALIAFPWFIAAAMRHDAWSTWRREILRQDATHLEPDPFYGYINLFALVIPWVVFFIGGLILAGQSLRRARSLEAHRDRSATVLAFFLLIIPLIVMSFFSDKPARYLLPMIPSAAILIAQSVVMYLDAGPSWKPHERLGGIFHWIIIAVAGVGVPLFGATRWIESETAIPWFSWSFALPIAAAGAIVVGLGFFFERKRPSAIVWSTVLVMMILQATLARGYARSQNGTSEMRPIANEIRARFPDAEIRSYRRDRRAPEDLSIYLNKTVRPVQSEDEIESLAGDVVVMVYQREGFPLPPLPGSWQIVTTARRGKNHWHAMIRPTMMR